MERLIFPYVVYDANLSSLCKRTIPSGFIYTMNSSDAWMKQMGYDQTAIFIEKMMAMIFGTAESLVSMIRTSLTIIEVCRPTI